ncbi:MAG: hypothetical protein Q9164_005970 [Protoblastenia rupestris]
MSGAPARRRPGPRKSKGNRINGVEVPNDAELETDERPKPTPLFPDFIPPYPKPLTEAEKRSIYHFRHLRDSIHNGPLYTVLGDDARVSKAGATTAKATLNAFEGMRRYSQRYTKRKRAIPKLDTRPYVLELFPKELWSTLDPKAREANGVVESSTKGKSLQMPGYEKAEHAMADRNGSDEEEAGLKVVGKLGGRDDDDENQGLDGEDVDDEFSDEEDGGDYNAEQYFDDGGDDAGEDYDAGGDGSGYFE